MQDDCPYEAEGELGVPVDDVLASDVDQLDLLVAEEPEGRLHVLDGVETHAAALAGLEEKFFLGFYSQIPIKGFYQCYHLPVSPLREPREVRGGCGHL